jgi:uncharacterized membrane protein
MTVALPMGVVAVLSLGVAAWSVLAYALLPLGAAVHPDMRAAFEAQRAVVYVHAYAAAFALALGPLQFSARLRAARPALHRWTGRLYLGVGVAIGGVAGLAMAPQAYGGTVARAGFAALALAWLYTGLRAWRAIRARDVAAHRRWMVRNFALTFAAVTLRLWLPVSVVSGLPLALAYPGIAWLCWVPNLWVAEFMILGRSRPARAAVNRNNR